MKKYFFLCALLFSFPCLSESALNLSQYKTIRDLYFNSQATDEIMKRMSEEVKHFYDPHDGKPFGYSMSVSDDKGIIYHMNNGLYFGKICFQGSCDMFLQEKGHEPIIMDTLRRDFYIFFKNPLSQKETNKILSESQKIILENAKKSKKFMLKLHFFNQ